MSEKPSVLGDALIHTVALAQCTLGTSSVGNRLNGFRPPPDSPGAPG
jgi:hypothetical protein